jgi:hypothetical protein
MKREYEINKNIVLTCKNLLDNYINNQKNSRELLKINDDIKDIILNYLFLFYYKIYYYLNEYINENIEETYFKDVLSFNVRHTNHDIFVAIKKTIIKNLKIKISDNKEKFYDSLMNLFFNEKILGKFIYANDKCALINTSEYLSIKNRANPKISLIGYLEKLNRTDWLIKNVDNVSQKYLIKKDIVIIENRFFNHELKTLYKNETNINITEETFTLNQMIKFVELYEKK